MIHDILNAKTEYIDFLQKIIISKTNYHSVDQIVADFIDYQYLSERSEKKIVKATGHGQSECYLCNQNGKYSLNWTSFLYRVENDNFEHLYCYECAKKLEGS